jgi:hypothetical protein
MRKIRLSTRWSQFRKFALLFCITFLAVGRGSAVADLGYLHRFRAAADAEFGSSADQAKAAQLRYGKPDIDQSGGSPPQLVTRWFVYRRAGIRIVFSPVGGTPTMPRSWVMIGFIDTRSDQQIDFAAGDSRLMAARR